jgi:putative endonuclease
VEKPASFPPHRNSVISTGAGQLYRPAKWRTCFLSSWYDRRVESKTYYAYIVASRSRTLYVGFTSNLFTRVLQHRNGTYEGFTSTYSCHCLVWYECFGHPTEAISREKQIKRWSRAKKITLIEHENPTWVDLSADWGKPTEPYQWPK